MDITNPRHAWAAAISGLVLLVLVIALFMQGAESESPPKPLGHPSPTSGRGPVAMQKIMLPSGVERSMTQNIPLIGQITGARWIPGHRFQVRAEKRIPMNGPDDIDRNTAPPMDVLVDADGGFIMARLNGEKFATRPHTDSLKKLLGNILEWQKPYQPANALPPAVIRLAFPKIAWDDPALGESITGRYFTGYLSEPTSYKKHLEESFTLLDVWLEGDTANRRVLLARYTEGLALPRYGPKPRNDENAEPVIGSNQNGAYVATRAAALQWEEGLQAPAMHLIEPWEGPCPWLPAQLDPECAENRLNEFMLPAEFNGYPTDIFDSVPRLSSAQRESMSAAAAQRKAARLAAEAAVQK